MFNNPYSISDRIKEIAIIKGVKLQELYAAANVNPSVLYDMKKSFPKVDTLARIAEALGVSIDYLCGRKDTPEI